MMQKHRFTTTMICRDNATGKTFKKVLVHGDQPFTRTVDTGGSSRDYDLCQPRIDRQDDERRIMMWRQAREHFEHRLLLEIGTYYWRQFPPKGLF